MRMLWRELSLKQTPMSSQLWHLNKAPSALDRFVVAFAAGKLARLHIIAQLLLCDKASVLTIATTFKRIEYMCTSTSASDEQRRVELAPDGIARDLQDPETLGV